MKVYLYVDIFEKKLVYSKTDTRQAAIPTLYRQDTPEYVVTLLRPNPTGGISNRYDVVDITSLSLRIGIGDYISGTPGPMLALQTTWAKDTGAMTFTGTLSLDTTNCVNAVNAAVSGQITSAFEIEVLDGSNENTVFRQTVTIKGDVVRTDSVDPGLISSPSALCSAMAGILTDSSSISWQHVGDTMIASVKLPLSLTAAARSGLTAGVEAPDFSIDLARNVQFATGSLGLQRACIFTAPTYAFVGASTLSKAATFAVMGAPTPGTNATITTSIALLIGNTSSSATNVYGIYNEVKSGGAGGLVGNQVVVTATADIGVVSCWRGYMVGASGKTIGTGHGLRIDPPVPSGGTITTNYGIFLDYQKVTGVTAAYGIYQQGDDPNYFNGKIGICNATPDCWLHLVQPVCTSGSASIMKVVGGSHTTLAASTELIDVKFSLERTVQFATGAITTQRAFRIGSPTYAFVGASTITTAATLTIMGAPTAGTNATITDSYGLWIDNTAVAAKVTGIYCNPQTSVSSSPRGIYVQVETTYAGGTSLAYGVVSCVKSASGNTIINAAGFAAGSPIINSGAVTASTGLVIFAQKISGVTTGYGIQQVGTSDLNYFLASATGFGTSSPTATVHVVQAVSASGSPTGFMFAGGAHTTLTASTEAIDVNINLNRTVQFAGGALTTQRAFLIQAPTYAFASGSVLTTAATLAVTGAPIQGTSATILASYAILVDGSQVSNAAIVAGVGLSIEGSGSKVYGGSFISKASKSGTSSECIGLRSAVKSASGNTITLGAALYALSPIPNSGAITSAYGLYLEGQTVGGVTNAWGIYQAGTSDFNWLAGMTAIGGSSPAAMLDVTQNAASGGVPHILKLTGGAHTGLSVEAVDAVLDLSHTVTFSGGVTISLQRAFALLSPTYAAASASTITVATSAHINGPPIAGTNMTLTSASALHIYNLSGTATAATVLYGVYNAVRGTGVLQFEGYNLTSQLDGSTSCSAWYGFRAIMSHNSTSSIGELVQFKADSTSISNGGTITTAIGLKIGTQKSAGVTTGYGIYQAYSGDINYFAGVIKLGNASLLGTALAGAFENDGKTLHWTATTAIQRGGLPLVLFIANNTTTLANSTTETTLIPAGNGSLTALANFPSVGGTVEVEAMGTYKTDGGSTFTLKLKLGSDVFCTVGAWTPGSITGDGHWDFRGKFTYQSLGGAGSIWGQGVIRMVDASGNKEFRAAIVTSAATVVTNADKALDFTGTWGTASAARSITTTNFEFSYKQH